MTFRIKHENKLYLIIPLISILLLFLFVFLNVIPFLFFVLFDIIISLFFILYFVEQIVGTAIVIEDRTVTIKYLLGREIIAIEEICNLDIEPYQRYRRGNACYTEYRMRMTINLLSDKKIVLTDKATAVKGTAGFLLNIRERVPDEDVELYKAYQIINSMLY